MAGRAPAPVGPGAGRGGLRRAALAEAVRARRRSRPPAGHRRRAAPRRRAAAEQPDRHRLGRSRRSCTPAPRSRRSATSCRCSRRRRSGASCSASPRRAATSRRCARARCATATSTSINGSKIWTSAAHLAKFGILIARTDPDAPKHKGISYFICPMDTPGIEIRPIVEMTGAHMFNEVFFTDVAHPGREPRRRRERGMDAGQGDARQRAGVAVERRRAVGDGPDGGGPARPRAQGGRRRRSDRRASGSRSCTSRRRCSTSSGLRTVSARIRGEQPGPEASIRKVLADEHGQHIMRVARDLAGAGGMLATGGPLGHGRGAVVLRLPVQSRAHDRRRHRRGAALHHRRTRARPSARASLD